MNEEKAKLVASTISKVQKEFGNNSIVQLGADTKMNIERFPSGSLALDHALGGGVPKGRIIEVFGPESSGKTTLTLHMIAEIQKQGGVAAFIDAEHALDPEYARNIGVDTNDLYVAQPDNGEQALSIVSAILDGGGFDLVVIDSVAALVPKAELEGDIGDARIGLHARLMSQSLRMLTGKVSKSGCTLVFINQIREKVGVMYGNPETTTGGRALKFYASVRLDVRKVETLKDGGEATANHVKVRVVKNKVAPPFRTAEFDITFGEGISRKSEVANIAVELGIIDKRGAWFSYKDIKVQGLDSIKKMIDEDEAFMDELVTAITNRMNGVEEEEVYAEPVSDTDVANDILSASESLFE